MLSFSGMWRGSNSCLKEKVYEDLGLNHQFLWRHYFVAGTKGLFFYSRCWPFFKVNETSVVVVDLSWRLVCEMSWKLHKQKCCVSQIMGFEGEKKAIFGPFIFFFTVHFTQNSFFYRGPGVCKCCRVYACVAEVTLLIKGAELFQLRNDYSWNVLQV